MKKNAIKCMLKLWTKIFSWKDGAMKDPFIKILLDLQRFHWIKQIISCFYKKYNKKKIDIISSNTNE